LSLTDCKIIDTTLREGEQFIQADFASDDRVEIARALDAFGVEYIEVASPSVSPQSRRDCTRLARLGLGCKVLTHIRCHLEDAKAALETGVDGINLVIGTSSYLRRYSHGKAISEIIDLACEVLSFIREQAPEMEIRFSTEDSFRSEVKDVLRVDMAIDQLGIVNRFGVADTVGVATPHQVYELVRNLRQLTYTDIEFHGHNDTGCAVANAHAALEAGATHIDTSILGIGERNGITPLEGLIARLYAGDRTQIQRKYRLYLLPELSRLVADKVGVAVPFNHYITGAAAFSHKAGIHAKAVLRNPETYESLDPNDFGLARSIAFAHKHIGWNVLQDRATQLGLELDEMALRAATQFIKALADGRKVTEKEVDLILRRWAEDPAVAQRLFEALPV
jgi:homocitrate synthase